ncbi:hypothetical protein Ciccas_005012 [Cichlidogyrus casuarinus]|uniref:Uncharacterized protein n=1 Tax=Cichlidogyrus casuarinus TaxID=1844966 RepID=A0ABD2Q9X9_9PLAT
MKPTVDHACRHSSPYHSAARKPLSYGSNTLRRDYEPASYANTTLRRDYKSSSVQDTWTSPNESRSYKSIAFKDPHYRVTCGHSPIRPISGELNEDTLRKAFPSCSCDPHPHRHPEFSRHKSLSSSFRSPLKLQPCTCFPLSQISQTNLNFENQYMSQHRPYQCTAVERAPSFKMQQPTAPNNHCAFNSGTLRRSVRRNDPPTHNAQNAWNEYELEPEVMHELEKYFPSLFHGFLPACELKNALKIAGLDLAGHEIRELEEDLIHCHDGKIPIHTFTEIYSHVKEIKDQSKTFKRENILKERPDLRVRFIATTE